MDISVIIPSYKPQLYIYDCLRSIASQSLNKERYEVILVLNGCCNPWKAEIENYAQSYLKGLNFILIQLDEGGVSNARNYGINKSVGDYITFLDDDDYVSPSYLEELLKVSKPDLVGIARPIAFTEGENESQPYTITNVFDRFYPSSKISFLRLRRYFSGPCMKLIHRTIIGERRFNTSFTVGEDGLFMFTISDRIHYCSLAEPSAIYYRRYRFGSLTTKRDRSFIQSNNLRLLKALSKVYFHRPYKYNIVFYLMQVLSCIYGIIH